MNSVEGKLKGDARHPSYLELDRMAVGADQEESAQHVEQCEVCSNHLARIAQPAAVPTWVHELERETGHTSSVRRFWTWATRLAMEEAW